MATFVQHSRCLRTARYLEAPTDQRGKRTVNFPAMLKRPHDQVIRDYLTSRTHVDLNYVGQGLTRTAERPDGYALNYRRDAIGHGSKAFESACKAVRAWEMFGMGWVELCWPDAPIEVGTVVGVVAHRFGLWSLNPCRIVYVLEDDDGETARYGFGYGTLPGHIMRGEERFLVEWDRKTDAVSYEIYSFARPDMWVSWIVFPAVRVFQRLFAQASANAMRTALLHTEQHAEDAP